MNTYTKSEVDQMITEAEDRAVEKALRILPGVIEHLIAGVSYIKEKQKDFAKDYPDLANHTDLVKKTMETLESDNPGMDLGELLKKTAVEARKRLENKNQMSLDFPSKPTENSLQTSLDDLLGD